MKSRKIIGGGAALVLAASGFLGGCGSSYPPPSISNINNSTTPTSPTGLAIEINGNNFQRAPGKVIFTQGSMSAPGMVAAGGWSNTSIVAVVPSGGTTNFTVPGMVTVTVKTSGGTSNGVTLNLVQTSAFSPSNLVWGVATPLPVPLTGLRTVVVQSSNTTAVVIVAGGFNGAANVSTVYTNTLAQDGSLGTTWATSSNPLPNTLAHFGMVEANAQNSLVPANSHFIYVIGGQVNSSDTPGGTNTVYMASVDQTTGAVGTWKTLTTVLPDSLVGPAVTIYNGHIYVAGGLDPQQVPVTDLFSAPINSDGTLGSWTKSTNALPLAISFATAFGFGGNLYVLNGDPNGSSDPNQSATVGLQDVRIARANNGVVGTWALSNTTIKKRKKHNTWVAFGQVIDAEGIYDGGTGLELERSSINADGTLASWNGLTGSNVPSANVFNAASVVSPLLSSAGNPRFLLLGGETVTTTPGVPTASVFVNTAP
ncbi:MAG TPA: hypothetical protein VFN26_08605 [Candidatus Acidoferrum sp.]|nr:hypothetical protein [Candidatus Acidoferrum sp.]